MRIGKDCELYSFGIGTAFYFFGDPSRIRNEMISVIEKYFGIITGRMTYFSGDDGRLRSARGKRFPDYISGLIRERNFHDTLSFRVYDCTKERSQSKSAGLSLTDFDGMEHFGLHTPKTLHFLFPADTPLSAVREFMYGTFPLLRCQYALCAPVISANPLYSPRSDRAAVGQLMEYPLFMPEFTRMFINAVQHEQVGSVGLIQLFSEHYKTAIEGTDIRALAATGFRECDGGYALDLLDNEAEKLSDCDGEALLARHRTAAGILAPVTAHYGKNMYFKPYEWETWADRFK